MPWLTWYTKLTLHKTFVNRYSIKYRQGLQFPATLNLIFHSHFNYGSLLMILNQMFSLTLFVSCYGFKSEASQLLASGQNITLASKWINIHLDGASKSKEVMLAKVENKYNMGKTITQWSILHSKLMTTNTWGIIFFLGRICHKTHLVVISTEVNRIDSVIQILISSWERLPLKYHQHCWEKSNVSESEKKKALFKTNRK